MKGVTQVPCGGVVVKRLDIPCDLGSTLTLPIIFCGIQVKGEDGWRLFVLAGGEVFTDYSTVVSSGG
ncbi:hypothetical protein Hanom_Chr17g01541941 [Helianthus anomalus]